MAPFQTAAAVGSGVIVGSTLGLAGGGGSILAVPLLVYVVGMPDPHWALGTGAVAVAVNAFANLVPHAREQHVRWHPALIFAAAGLAGAFAGSSIGKAVDGRRLLILFALLMLFVVAMMLRGGKAGSGPVNADRRVNPSASKPQSTTLELTRNGGRDERVQHKHGKRRAAPQFLSPRRRNGARAHWARVRIACTGGNTAGG